MEIGVVGYKGWDMRGTIPCVRNREYPQSNEITSSASDLLILTLNFPSPSSSFSPIYPRSRAIHRSRSKQYVFQTRGGGNIIRLVCVR